MLSRFNIYAQSMLRRQTAAAGILNQRYHSHFSSLQA
jgi:hypothetical protein